MRRHLQHDSLCPAPEPQGHFRTPWPPRPAVDLEDRIRNRVERAREKAKHDVDARRKKDAKVERHKKKNQNDSKTQQADKVPSRYNRTQEMTSGDDPIKRQPASSVRLTIALRLFRGSKRRHKVDLPMSPGRAKKGD